MPFGKSNRMRIKTKWKASVSTDDESSSGKKYHEETENLLRS
jgi:hypothetical protein